MHAAVSNADLPFGLLQELERRANSLSPSAASAAALLRSYIAEIEDASQINAALVRLKEFSWNYKGMRDIVVPGVPESEWFQFVTLVQNLSVSACRARGLDRSIVGRMSTAVRRLFGFRQVERRA